MNKPNWQYLGEVGYEGDIVIITDSENFPKFFDPRSSLILLTEEEKKQTQKHTSRYQTSFGINQIIIDHCTSPLRRMIYYCSGPVL